MGIVVIGTAFVDIKGFPDDLYIPNVRMHIRWWDFLRKKGMKSFRMQIP